MASGRLDMRKMITTRYPLDRAAEAITSLANREGGKIMVKMRISSDNIDEVNYGMGRIQRYECRKTTYWRHWYQFWNESRAERDDCAGSETCRRLRYPR